MALSKVQLEQENQSNFPDNNQQLITPQLLREFNTDMIDSLVDENTYNADSASWNAQIAYLDPSGSIIALNALEAFTASAEIRLDALEQTSQSLNQFTASQYVSNSYFATTGSNTFTGNQTIAKEYHINTNGIYWNDNTVGYNNLEIINSGYGNVDIASINGRVRIVNSPLFLTGSALTSSNDISTSANIYAANLTGSTINTASFATTGSNTFRGTQTISGSVLVSSSLTANVGITLPQGAFAQTFIDQRTRGIRIYNSDTYSETYLQLGQNSPAGGVVLSQFGSKLGINVSTTITGDVSASNGISSSTINGIGNVTLFSASVNSRLLAITGSTIDTGSLVTTASFNAYTASQDFKNTTFATTASVNALSESIFQTDATQSNNINSLTSKTGSYATTGSNIFVGNQTVNGDISASGNISASSLYATNATIVNLTTIYETSSVIYSSGSNQLGDALTDTQILSGSVFIVGSGSVNGNRILTTEDTASLVVSSSLYSVTSSYAVFAQTASEARNVVVIARNGNQSTLNAGTVVRITSAVGDNPIFNTSSYDSETLSSNTLGILRNSIASGADGEVVVNGVVLGVNTDPTLGYVAGDVIYLSSSGQFTRVQPQAPKQTVTLGEVLRVQQNNGSIYVNISNGWELNELHNVQINTPLTNDLLAYESSSYGLWKNKSFSSLGLATTSSVNDLSASLYFTDTTQSNNIASNSSSIGLLQTFSGSQYKNDSSSFDSRIDSLEIASGGFVTTSSFNSYTSSQDFKNTTFATTGSNTFTGQQTLSNTGDLQFPLQIISGGIRIDDPNTDWMIWNSTANGGLRRSNNADLELLAQSASLNIRNDAGRVYISGSQILINDVDFIPFSTSVDSRLDTEEFKSTTFATTGSNTFVGNQTINADLSVSQSKYIRIGDNQSIGTPFGNSLVIESQGGNTIRNLAGGGDITLQNTQGIISISGSGTTIQNVDFIPFSSSLNSRINGIVAGTGFATTGSNIFNGDQTISNGVLQVATYPQTTKQWFSPTAIEAIGTASVAYEQYVDGGGYDAFNLITTLDSGSQFRDLRSDTFALETWLAIPRNTGNNPPPQFKRGLGVTGSVDITGQFTINGVPISGSGGTSGGATTGSNTFTGNQTILGAIVSNPTTSLTRLFSQAFVSGATQYNITASNATSQSNLVFGGGPSLSTLTGSVIISGSGNILHNPAKSLGGTNAFTIGYVGGNNNYFTTIPQLHTQSLVNPTMNANIGTGVLSMNFITSSLQNPVVVNNNFSSNIVLNHQSGTINMQNNISNGIITSTQNGLTSGTVAATFNNNIIGGGGITLNHTSSSIQTTVNAVFGAVTANNNYYHTGSNNALSLANNLTNGQGITINAGGSPSTNVARPIVGNLLGGQAITIQADAVATDLGGLRNEIVYGYNLIVSGSQSTAATTQGGAFFGRYNDITNLLADSGKTIFAVGTGTSTSARRTAFSIDSGSNVLISGSLIVSNPDSSKLSIDANAVVSASKLYVGNNSVGVEFVPSTGSITDSYTRYSKDSFQIYQYQGQPYAFGVICTSDQLNAYTGSQFRWGTVNGTGAIQNYMNMVSASYTGSIGGGSAIPGLDYLKDGQILQINRGTTFDKNVFIQQGLYVSQSIGGPTPALTLNGTNGSGALIASGSVKITGSFEVNGQTTFATLESNRFTQNQIVSASIYIASNSDNNQLYLPSGSNRQTGLATLDGGTPSSVTVSNNLVTANSIIMLTKQTNGTPAAVSISSKGSNTFTITSNVNGDADVVAYMIINPS